MATPISAVLIALNEEKYIERCLNSLLWADEIVVVDGGSTDATLTLCNNPTAPWAKKIKVLSKPFENFRIQRNFSLESVKNDWILIIDADEACTPELTKKLLSLAKEPNGPPLKAYKVHRQEYFLGKRIYWGIWNPSYQDRFFNRIGVQYINDIHEYPNYPPNPGIIHEALDHAPDFGIDKFLYKMNKYTSIEAKERVKNGQRTNAFRMVFAFPAMFWKNYFYYKSYRDGMHGLVISILEGISRAVRHVKIWYYTKELKHK